MGIFPDLFSPTVDKQFPFPTDSSFPATKRDCHRDFGPQGGMKSVVDFNPKQTAPKRRVGLPFGPFNHSVCFLSFWVIDE